MNGKVKSAGQAGSVLGTNTGVSPLRLDWFYTASDNRRGKVTVADGSPPHNAEVRLCRDLPPYH
jgi:hypothetical protein